MPLPLSVAEEFAVEGDFDAVAFGVGGFFDVHGEVDGAHDAGAALPKPGASLFVPDDIVFITSSFCPKFKAPTRGDKTCVAPRQRLRWLRSIHLPFPRGC